MKPIQRFHDSAVFSGSSILRVSRSEDPSRDFAKVAGNTWDVGCVPPRQSRIPPQPMTVSRPATSVSAFSTQQIIMMLWQRKWWLLITAVIVTALVWWRLEQITPLYQAEAKLGIQRIKQFTTENAFEQESGARVEFGQLNAVKDEILARPVLVAALQTSGEINVAPYVGKHNPGALLESRVRIVTSRDSWALTIVVLAEHPERATKLCQALVDSYRTAATERRDALAQDAHTFLIHQVELGERKLSEAVEAEQNFRLAHGIVSSDPDANPITRRLQEQAQQGIEIEKMSAMHNAVQERLKAAEATVDPDARRQQLLAIDRVVADGRVSAALLELRAAESLLNTLSQKYGPKHPRRIEAEATLAEKRQRLDETLLLAKATMAEERQLSLVQLRENTQIQAATKQELTDLRQALIRLQALSEQVSAQRAILSKRRDEQARVEFASSMEKDFTYLIEPAAAGMRPANKPKLLFIVGSLMSGLICGLTIATIAAFADRRITRAEDVHRFAPDLPILGRIPRVRKDALIPHETDRPPVVAESFRRLRSALPHKGQRRIIIVTSAQSGDGKSTVTSRLGHSFARSGIRTLLIDGDLRHPSLSVGASLSQVPGFAEALNGEAIMPHTVAKGLDILPGGIARQNPGDLLTRATVSAVLERLQAAYDLILIDTPPVSAVADAIAVAEIADGILLVARARVTNRRRLAETLIALEPLRKKLLGFVISADPDIDLEQMVSYLGLGADGATATDTLKATPTAVVTPAVDLPVPTESVAAQSVAAESVAAVPVPANPAPAQAPVTTPEPTPPPAANDHV